MEIRQVIGQTLGVIASSTGLSQAAGLLGLTTLALKEVSHKVNLAYLEHTAKQTPNSYREVELRGHIKEIKGFHQARANTNKNDFKACALLMVPIFGTMLTQRYGKVDFQRRMGNTLAFPAANMTKGEYVNSLMAGNLYKDFSGTAAEKFDACRRHTLRTLDPTYDNNPVSCPTKQVSITTGTGDPFSISEEDPHLDAVWSPHSTPTDKTVVLFHPNAGVLDGMLTEAMYFKKKGFNILMVTTGGNPGTQGNPPFVVNQASLSRDVTAVKNWLDANNVSKDNILAYGHSMGGSMALDMGARHPGVHVIANKTFSVLTEVPKTMINLPVITDLAAKLLKKGTEITPEQMSQAATPEQKPLFAGVTQKPYFEETEDNFIGKHKSQLPPTESEELAVIKEEPAAIQEEAKLPEKDFDNTEKASLLKGRLAVIGSKDDWMMHNSRQGNMVSKIAQAYDTHKTAGTEKATVIMTSGGHNDAVLPYVPLVGKSFATESQQEVAKAVDDFLQEIGFADKNAWKFEDENKSSNDPFGLGKVNVGAIIRNHLQTDIPVQDGPTTAA